MKARPPRGVMAPSARMPVTASRYRLPENSTVPATKSQPAAVVAAPGQRATGFVMSGLARHLAARGHAVVAADLHAPDAVLRGYLGGPVTFRQIDVADPAAVHALLAEVRPERFVHGAAITAIPAEAERD